jgi:hypothetical protein
MNPLPSFEALKRQNEEISTMEIELSVWRFFEELSQVELEEKKALEYQHNIIPILSQT